ncbi:hypothetical protein PsorP6_016493 [Peronosclerospora sorghi]|uniref:Uncharacterized protein n=1 Tax=Peronosclerospora sorghi TaxID=230839 RepID=A0ACC0VQI6_9STRA|nr:hypothetical protein PsorP6_016493 [Peronosclerospora sorghi]
METLMTRCRDDPVWVSAPCMNLQPPLYPSLMKKASNVSVTDSQTSFQPHEDEEKPSQEYTSSNEENDKSTLCNDSNTKLATAPKLQKCSSVSMNQTVTVPSDANMMTRSQVNSRGKWRLPARKKRSGSPVKDPINISATEKNGFRESMMCHRPSDLKPQDFTATMMSRASFALAATRTISAKVAAATYSTAASIKYPFGSSRRADAMSGRGSVLHFRPRVKEEGLSVYLRAVKSSNLQLLRACLENRKTDITE